ncbi:hypothetical protein N7456_004802 [Penicillium angulare]|uniref:Uncharacterized protein n=1 Tax=Penicillium angulare TaxID=116970 RepID=A0A9W9FYX8_9EURO|nr:hypothetical protein N7456_004802 [Penicillium angulare]
MSSDMVSQPTICPPEPGYFGGVSQPRPSRFQEDVKDLESQNSSSLNSSPKNAPTIPTEAELKKLAKAKKIRRAVYFVGLLLACGFALVLGMMGSGIIKNQASPIERNNARPETAGPLMQSLGEDVAAMVTSDYATERVRRNSEIDLKLDAWFNLPENLVNDKARLDRAG